MVATVMEESNIELNKEEYLQKFAPDMMEITQRWCQGAKFTEICEDFSVLISVLLKLTL